jgi:SLA1 homology domain 1, SHD1
MRTSPFFVTIVLLVPTLVSARVWTDSTGKYSIEANLVAFNDTTVILQRADHQLGQVAIDKLSQADRDYLKGKEAGDAAKKVSGAIQTWTLRSGEKILGRVVGFARKSMTVQRRRGNIYVNDRLLENLPKIYQTMIPKIVAHDANLVRDDRQALEDWLVTQKGQPQAFTIEGPLFEFEGGDEYVIPFFFFSMGEQNLLKPGWDQWVAANNKKQYDQASTQEFLVQSLMAARQRDEQIQQQIAQMELNQAVLSGATQLWEVTLYPGRGVAGSPQWVVMPGINSGEASANAIAKYPGYIAGPVRKVAGY